MLEPDAEGADVLGRLDEGAAHIMVADDAVFERNAAALRIAERGGRATIGHRHHDVGLDRGFVGKVLAHALAGRVDRAAGHNRIRTGEIDIFEQADPFRALRERLEAVDGGAAIVLDLADDDFAILDIADELGADDVERAGLGGQRSGSR